MLVYKKKYEFTNKDIGKTVVLKDFTKAKIVSVIRENGGITTLVGKSDDQIIFWDSYGLSELPEKEIGIIIE